MWVGVALAISLLPLTSHSLLLSVYSMPENGVDVKENSGQLYSASQ